MRFSSTTKAATQGIMVLGGMALAAAACSFDTAGVEWPTVCGDGVAQGNEACDVVDFRGESCQSLGMSPGTLACTATCAVDTSGCGPAVVCGDGVRQNLEQCDGGDLGGASCASLGLVGGTLGCAATCQFDTAGCSVQPVCGNGQVEGAEQCDDGNQTACDGCSATCQSEACGNGRVECAEQCDDGNLAPGDGCDPQCRHEVLPGCGDGHVDAGEQCDDGNQTPCDGCSATCQQEACGNGRVECAEACDDGNSDPTDACLNDCTMARCGDGVIRAGLELCDSGNVPSTCEAEGYGGGILGCASNCLSYDTSQCASGDGAPCTADAQCAGGICYSETATGFPGGFCSRDCSLLGSSCTNGTVCIDLSAGGGTGERCYRQCSSSANCRPGYVCQRDPFENTTLVCRPLCESNTHCVDTGICNPWTGRCGSLASATDSNNGVACSGSTAPYCKGSCWTNPPEGYCISPCNTTTGVCPGDGVCIATQDSSDGDAGWCLDGCTSGNECRLGYYCRSVTGDDYCWPNGW